MQANLKAIDNRVACSGGDYSLTICLVPDSDAEAMQLGILSQTLRKVGIWCVIHLESGRLEVMAAKSPVIERE